MRVVFSHGARSSGCRVLDTTTFVHCGDRVGILSAGRARRRVVWHAGPILLVAQERGSATEDQCVRRPEQLKVVDVKCLVVAVALVEVLEEAMERLVLGLVVPVQ